MKNPCWKGYEAYGMKKKNGKEVPNCVPIKEGIKFNILNNFMENAIMESKTKTNKDNKPKHAPRGPQPQRPKRFGKGGKAGTEQTQDRREGQQQAREMYEAVNVPLHSIQQRMNDSIKQKSSDNIARLRSLMGSPNSLNTENTPQTGTLAPEARADILSGDPERQEGVLRGIMHAGGKAAQKLRKMNKSKNINEGKVGSDKEKMEDPSSVGPPIDQAIIDAASLGGTTPLRVTPNVERILRDEQAYRNKLDTHINNYADYVNDLTKNIRLRSTGGYSKLNMYPEEGTR